MTDKKTKDPNITFTLRRDFGLGQYRLALPSEERTEQEGKEDRVDLAANMPSEKKQKRKSGVFSLSSGRSTQVVPKGRSAYGGRMNKLMQTDYETQKRSRKRPKSAQCTPQLAARLAESLKGKASPGAGRPSPSLHSRLLNKGILNSDGEKRGSLENLRQTYGLEAKPKVIGQLSLLGQLRLHA